MGDARGGDRSPYCQGRLQQWTAGLPQRYRSGPKLNTDHDAATQWRQHRLAYRHPAPSPAEDLCDVIVYSHEEGLRKPDPAIYVVACERLGVELAEAVFLDDVDANVTAARQVGMTAVRFRNNAQAMRDIDTILDRNT